MIGFNKPYLTGNELTYIAESVASEKISGDGIFTRRCHDFFCARYGFPKVLLTTSCTDALEMAALLCNIQPGDEVIAPSYTFVSTANAFALRGAKIVFVDSRPDHPCMDVHQLAAAITSKTKAIIAVHYAGVAVDMNPVMQIAGEHGLLVVEDAAQAIDSFYYDRPLGSIGHFAAFSFHETKNVMCGEGGMLVVNDKRFIDRAEIIREKGTNRSSFFRGETDKYNWVDLGSSFLPSDITAAFLFAQLESVSAIQEKRKAIWATYEQGLKAFLSERGIGTPQVPDYASNNAHMYYLTCRSLAERNELIAFLKTEGVQAVFHYLPLHESPFYRTNNPEVETPLPFSKWFAERLVRLPLYYELRDDDMRHIIHVVRSFFLNARRSTG